ncbi:hypothetical protein LuPra_02296 [Luteitalea pratensis]|uniref:Uncharacterized protein n=1 Tax=Luteitalea pratensis TaxID=1855912 RepID=A0A143PKJ2_LUTPR|nr:hypothetical protein [Luteitalea pratensis]AMY09085.1 hypothetical protein LuPra_02296 [Luteitalea pratensis]
MTETRRSDERLADVFRAIEDSSAVAVSDSDRERIWLAISGELPPEERRALVDQMATTPAYAEAWRVAHEMWRASQGTAAEAADTPVRHYPRRWTAPWVAAAAVLLVGTTIGLVSLREQQSVDKFRSSPGYVIESRVPDAGALPREAFRLQWAAGPEGSRYRVRVTTEDLVVLATAADLAAAEFSVAATQLSELPPGTTVLWQVDAYLPDGERVTSRTFVTHVR